jgi:hypothetical protein
MTFPQIDDFTAASVKAASNIVVLELTTEKYPFSQTSIKLDPILQNKLCQCQNFGVGVIKINNFFNPINLFCAIGITTKDIFLH